MYHFFKNVINLAVLKESRLVLNGIKLCHCQGSLLLLLFQLGNLKLHLNTFAKLSPNQHCRTYKEPQSGIKFTREWKKTGLLFNILMGLNNKKKE